MGRKSQSFNFTRKLRCREFNKRIYIFCQGTNTEPEYFKYFKNTNRIISLQINIDSEHRANALQFVNYALKNYKDEINNYDEFWLVFDKDETPNDDFNNAIKLAGDNKCKVAYSIQAFEIWYIHHFKEFSAQLNRNDYKKELTKLLGFEYSKDKNTSKKVAEKLYHKFDQAIINSEKSYNKFEQSNPATEESSTTVCQLAISIKPFIKN